MIPAARVAEAVGFLIATVAAYRVGVAVHARSGGEPIVNAVLVAVVLIAGLLAITHVPYSQYATDTRPLSLILGPATVALALPLFRSIDTLRQALKPVGVAVVVGVGAASGSAILLGRLLGANHLTLRSLAPKSVTTPIAMEVSARIGGDPSLTAVFVIVTGMIGAMVVPGVFRVFGIHDARARGLGLGVAAHGLGTARAITLGATELSFAVLGMGLSGVVTPLVVPWLARLFAA